MVGEVHLNTNGARVKRTFIPRRHPSMLHPLPRLPRPRPSARRTMAAPRHYSQPSRIRLNNVLPRPAFTTRGAWLSSENTSHSPLLHKRKEAALPERQPACCASPCLGILSTMCACTVLAPRYHVRCLVFIGARCGFPAFWVVRENDSSSGLQALLCGEGEVFRLDSTTVLRGHFVC